MERSRYAWLSGRGDDPARVLLCWSVPTPGLNTFRIRKISRNGKTVSQNL